MDHLHDARPVANLIPDGRSDDKWNKLLKVEVISSQKAAIMADFGDLPAVLESEGIYSVREQKKLTFKKAPLAPPPQDIKCFIPGKAVQMDLEFPTQELKLLVDTCIKSCEECYHHKLVDEGVFEIMLKLQILKALEKEKFSETASLMCDVLGRIQTELNANVDIAFKVLKLITEVLIQSNDSCSIVELERWVLKLIFENGEYLLQEHLDSFCELDCKQIKRILSSDQLQCNEDLVFDAVVRWVEKTTPGESETRPIVIHSVSFSPSASLVRRRSLLMNFLKLKSAIRFALMSPEKLKHSVENYVDFFTNPEKENYLKLTSLPPGKDKESFATQIKCNITPRQQQTTLPMRDPVSQLVSASSCSSFSSQHKDLMLSPSPPVVNEALIHRNTKNSSSAMEREDPSSPPPMKKMRGVSGTCNESTPDAKSKPGCSSTVNSPTSVMRCNGKNEIHFNLSYNHDGIIENGEPPALLMSLTTNDAHAALRHLQFSSSSVKEPKDEPPDYYFNITLDFLENHFAIVEKREEQVIPFMQFLKYFDPMPFLEKLPIGKAETSSVLRKVTDLWGHNINIRLNINGVTYLTLHQSSKRKSSCETVVLNYLKSSDLILRNPEIDPEILAISNCQFSLPSTNTSNRRDSPRRQRKVNRKWRLKSLTLYRVWGDYSLTEILTDYTQLKELVVWKLVPATPQTGKEEKSNMLYMPLLMNFSIFSDHAINNLKKLVLYQAQLKFPSNVTFSTNISDLCLEHCYIEGKYSSAEFAKSFGQLFPNLRQFYLLDLYHNDKDKRQGLSSSNLILHVVTKIITMDWLRVIGMNWDRGTPMANDKLAEILKETVNVAQQSSDFLLENPKNKTDAKKEHEVGKNQKWEGRDYTFAGDGYYDEWNIIEYEWYNLKQFYDTTDAFDNYFLNDSDNYFPEVTPNTTGKGDEF